MKNIKVTFVCQAISGKPNGEIEVYLSAQIEKDQQVKAISPNGVNLYFENSVDAKVFFETGQKYELSFAPKDETKTEE